MQITGDLQSSTKMEICPNMACVIGQKSDDLKSSIIECAVLVIYVHNWIRLIDKKGVPQKEKHDDI